ncbi:MAG: hypothetical protein ABSG50_06185 [Opitutaceae bacterium]
MKTFPQSLSEMPECEQQSLAGGNFAYDAGRVIRFIFIALTDCGGAPIGIGVPSAVGDWIVHSA